jgi:hypothetical protein
VLFEAILGRLCEVALHDHDGLGEVVDVAAHRQKVFQNKVQLSFRKDMVSNGTTIRKQLIQRT